MTGRTGWAVALIVFAAQGAVFAGGEPQDARIQELTARVQQLDERVRQLEQRLPAGKEESQSRTRAANLRSRFEARMEQDRATYSQAERQEIESLYQVANKQWDSPQAQESLKKLTKKYAKANRTGCALLYLGQMSSGEEKVKFLKRAIQDFGDCWYGDGVQVGSYARFHLAGHYQQTGRTADAAALFDEIRKTYPDAVDHRGNLLADAMPR